MTKKNFIALADSIIETNRIFSNRPFTPQLSALSQTSALHRIPTSTVSDGLGTSQAKTERTVERFRENESGKRPRNERIEHVSERCNVEPTPPICQE